MLYVMDKQISSNGTSLVLDTDDLTIEDTKCSDIHEYIKVGGKITFPFNTVGINFCEVEVDNDWFVVYAMSHEPKTQGIYLRLGRKGMGVLYRKHIDIIWNAYPVIELEGSKKNALLRISWNDKHYYREDRDEDLTKYIGVDASGNEVFITEDSVSMYCPYWHLDAKGNIVKED